MIEISLYFMGVTLGLQVALIAALYVDIKRRQKLQSVMEVLKAELALAQVKAKNDVEHIQGEMRALGDKVAAMSLNLHGKR